MYIILSSGGGIGAPASRKRGASALDDETGSCSGSGHSGSGSVIVGNERKRTKLEEEERDLDETIAEIVSVIDDQSKMLGKSTRNNFILKDVLLKKFLEPSFK